MHKYDRKKTMNEGYKRKIDEESCSPLKDITSHHTPSEMISNMELRKIPKEEKKTSDNTLVITDVNDKYTSNNNISDKVMMQSRNMNKSEYETYSNDLQQDDLKITDETNSKNMSVSNTTFDDNEPKRKSFIESRSRTNSYISSKPAWQSSVVLPSYRPRQKAEEQRAPPVHSDREPPEEPAGGDRAGDDEEHPDAG